MGELNAGCELAVAALQDDVRARRIRVQGYFGHERVRRRDRDADSDALQLRIVPQPDGVPELPVDQVPDGLDLLRNLDRFAAFVEEDARAASGHEPAFPGIIRI